MSTYVETAETKVIFKLQSENGTGTAFTDRTLTLPGQPSTDTEARAAWLEKCKNFRLLATSNTFVISEEHGLKLNQIVQPANWRDQSGSSQSDTAAPYKTIDVEFELYTVQKQRFTAEDFAS